MRHLILLLIVGIGGYFVWQYMGNAARVSCTLFIRQHFWKVLLIINLVISFFAAQALFGSAKFF